MPDTVAQQVSVFRSLIMARRFDDATLRLLESLLVFKCVKSKKEVESSLRALLRSESLSTIREIKGKPVDEKLSVLEFFVRAFALVADVESCLALRYEALHMRELESASCQWVEVSYLEWLDFAEQSLDNGFYSISGKACENAVLCLKRKRLSYPREDEFFENLPVFEKIKRLKDFAMTSAASCSVQAQAAKYLKKKSTEQGKTHHSFCRETQWVASKLFRNGIKKRNVRKLRKMQQTTRASHTIQL